MNRDAWRLLWYYMWTGQIKIWKANIAYRILGPKHAYYDGHIFAFGLWFYTIGLSDFKDRMQSDVKWNYVGLVNTLIKS